MPGYLSRKARSSAASQRALSEESALLENLRGAVAQWAGQGGSKTGVANAFEAVRVPFNEATRSLMTRVSDASTHLDAALYFLDRCYGDGQEMLVFASHLAVDPVFMRFVSAHGSESFVTHSQALMFHERGLDLLREVDELENL